jgi:hypothetical protein
MRFTFDSSLQNIVNNKVADLISDAMVKNFKFVMKTYLNAKSLNPTASRFSGQIFRLLVKLKPFRRM